MSRLLKQIEALKTPEEHIAWFSELSAKLEKEDITDAVRGLVLLGKKIIEDYSTLSMFASNTAMVQAINTGISDAVKAREIHTTNLLNRMERIL